MSKTSVDSTSVTVVKSNGRDSCATHPPTHEVQSSVTHSLREKSVALKPTVLYDMYSPPLSPHQQATPSSDLELTPHPSPPISPRAYTPARVEAHAMHDSTLGTKATSLQATNPIDLTTHTCADSDATTESPNELPRVGQEMVQNEQILDGSVALLVNISSRIDDLVKKVELISARVDLVETQMKSVHDPTAAHYQDPSTDTTHSQNTVTGSSNIDTPHILECKQSAHSQEFNVDHTHIQTPLLTHTPHCAHTSPIPSPPVSTPNGIASPHSKQTTRSSLRTSRSLSMHSTAPSTPVRKCGCVNYNNCYNYVYLFRLPGRGSPTNCQSTFQS